jgi:hypothetical protein
MGELCSPSPVLPKCALRNARMSETSGIHTEVQHASSCDVSLSQYALNDHPDTEFSDLENDLHGLSKNEFVDVIVQKTCGDEQKIILYKNYLAVQAKTIESCPKGALIHRKSTEKCSSAVKNASDCYILYQFKSGETSDIDKVFNKSVKSLSSNQITQPAFVETSAMSIVTAVQAEVASLQSIIKSLSNEVVELRKDNASLKLRVERIESTNSSKFSQIDAVQKQHNEAIKDIDAASDITNTIDRVQAMHGVLAKRVKDHIAQCEGANVSNSQQRNPVLDCQTSPAKDHIAQCENGNVSTCTGAGSPASEGQSSPGTSNLSPRSLKANDNTNSTVNSQQVVVSVQQKPLEIQLCVVCHLESSGAHRCVDCNYFVHVICGKTIGEEGYGSKVRCHSCTEFRNTSTHVAKARSMSNNTASWAQVTSVHSESSSKVASIPVRVNTRDSVQLRTPPPTDVFAGVRRKGGRTRRYYIGGITSTSSRQGLCDFLKQNNITPTGVRIMESANGYSKAAKVTVPVSEGHIMEEKGFWPDGVYCRRWYGVSEWSDRKSYSGRNSDNYRDDYGDYQDSDSHKYNTEQSNGSRNAF